MRRAVILLLFARAAAAQPADTVEGEQRALALPTETHIGSGKLHVRAFAEESTTSQRTWTEFAAGAGVDLVVAADECDLVRLGGAGRLIEGSTGDGVERHTSAETWASTCFHFTRTGMFSTTFQLGHHLEWDVRPSLLAPLGLRRGDNRRETVTFDFEPARILGSSMFNTWRGDVVLFDVDTSFAFLWERGGVPALVASVEAAPFRYARDKLLVDLFAVTGDFTDDAATIGMWGLRIQRGHIGALETSAGIGFAALSAGPFVTDVSRQIDVTVPRVLVAIGGGDETVHAELRATEDTQLLPDGAGAIDQRLSGTATANIRKYRLQLDASAGRTDLRIPDAMPVRAITGGATLTLTGKVTRAFELAESLTYARSFYAATATPTDPTWGIQAFVSLRASIGR